MPKLNFFHFLIAILFPLFCSAQTVFESEQVNFLPVDQAFELQDPILKNNTIIIRWLIKPDYYLYRNKLLFKIDSQELGNESIRIHSGTTIQDPLFGKVEVYEDSLTVLLEVKNFANTEEQSIEVNYQGCAKKGLCYPPQKRTKLVLRNDNGLTKKDSFFDNKSLLVLSGTFFVLGLLLAFTPCVLPMLPILSAVLLGLNKQTNKLNTSILCTVYVVSMALTYATFGALVATVGDGVQSLIRQDLIIGILVIFFLFMAVMTYIDFRLPVFAKFNNRVIQLSSAKLSGPIVTSASMGSLSAFVATPCVTPPLAAALAFILQTKSTSIGFVTLFFLGLGMGAPMLLLGSSLKFLIPKSGKWMLEIKNILSFILFGTAIWFADRIIKDSIIFIMWGGFTLLALIFFLIRYKKSNLGTASRVVPLIAIGLAVVNCGIVFSDFDYFKTSKQVQNQSIPPPDWANKASVSDVYDHITINQKYQKDTLIKFSADWCIECKHIETMILTSEEVIKNLENFVLVSIDVTEMNQDHTFLLKKFSVYGPPAFLVLDSTNFSVKARFVGSMDEKQFLDLLNFN